ncbi:MAG: hypothetical protein JSV86_12810 [Gemmatimonadota bacterium]|nr:MAG: hypothetical protein JSV86_12810 [Gemmatimonadota bacterium]
MAETTEAGTAPDVAAEHEAATDAIIAGIVGEDAEPEPEGEPVQEDEAFDESAEYDEADGEETEDQPAAPATLDGDDQKILAQWKLAGLPERVFGEMTSEERTAWSVNHSKQSSDAHRAFRERAELERRLQELEATPEAEPGVPTADVDYQEEKAALALQFGDDEAEALLKVAQKIARTETAPLQQQLAASSAAVEQLLNDRLQGEMGASDPRLQDPTTFNRVRSAAQGMWASDRHTDLAGLDRLNALMQDAALLELGPVSDGSAGDEPQEPQSRRRGTQPSRPTRAPSRRKPKTRDEIIDAKIRAIQGGATSDDVLRRFGSG